MLKFLPQKNKNRIIFEYMLRMAFFLLLSILVSSLVAASLFIPSFFYAKYKSNNINQQLVSAKQANANKGVDPVLFIKNVNRLSIALADNKNSSADYSDIIDKIVSLKNSSISITSIAISDDDSANTRMITVTGSANTRDGLTEYEKDLKIDGFFNSVIFPVTDFIQDSNSSFTATLVYKNK